MKEIIEAYFASRKEEEANVVNYNIKPGVITIGWTLSTSDEHAIEENWSELYDDDSEVEWDEITDSVRDFEGSYDTILEEYGTNPRAFGHGSFNELVGDLDVTVENLINILEYGENVGNGEIVFTSISGRFDSEEIDMLHIAMDATLTFYLPNDLYELL